MECNINFGTTSVGSQQYTQIFVTLFIAICVFKYLLDVKYIFIFIIPKNVTMFTLDASNIISFIYNRI